MKSGHVIRRLRFLLPCAVLIAFANTPAGAATNVVTTLADSGPGSLRQAIMDANAAGGGDIWISATGTITLAFELPPLNNISIVGGGSDVITVRGTNSGPRATLATNGFRVFTIPLNSTSALRGLTIADGYGVSPGGGAILNSGVLTLTKCALLSNTAVYGGGLFSATGSVALRECILIRNTSRGADAVTGGTVGGPAAGGGICATGTIMRIEDCLFADNVAAGGRGRSANDIPPACDPYPATHGGGATGGALHFSGISLFISNCFFSFNSAYGLSGGVSLCSTGANGGPVSGGALYVSGDAQILRSQFFTNLCDGGDGGNARGGGGGAAGGGAMALVNSSTFITDCSVIGNRAFGGTGYRGLERVGTVAAPVEERSGRPVQPFRWRM